MKKQIAILATLFLHAIVQAQNVGIGTLVPDASSLLELRSGDKGLLIPRVALSGANDVTTVPSPANTLLVFNTATAGSGRFAVSPGFYYYNSSSLSWVAITAADNSLKSAWLLGGNSNTFSGTNFIGTIDNVSLQFKINNTSAGFLGTTGNSYWGLNAGNNSSTVYSNVGIGNYALYLNTNRSNIVAVGDSALLNNGTGATTSVQAINNTALGSKTLYSNTLGSYNTAIGYNALLANTTGTQNTATGVDALHFNSTGLLNTATGINTLFLNTTGGFNAANGANSLVNNITGSSNTANGFGALFSNTTGFSNVAVGANALRSNVNLSNLLAVGDSALFNNGIGATELFHSIYNTAVGSKALYANTTGYGNTGIGYQALQNNTTGHLNTGIGMQAMQDNTTGSLNNSIGYGALINNTIGSNNNAFGYLTLNHNFSGYSNIAIGGGALEVSGSGNNIIAIGDSAMRAYTGEGITFNTAVGSKSLSHLVSGIRNTAFGYQTLFNNTSGYNTAFGDEALYNNTTGNGNVGTGSQSLYANTSGFDLTAIGYQSLFANTTGIDNTAGGYQSLASNSTGNRNTVFGSYNMLFNGIGSNNVSLGFQSLYFNTSGSHNTAIGTYALSGNSVGNSNVAVGVAALSYNTKSNLVAVGDSALYFNGFGSPTASQSVSNTALGSKALYTNTLGSKNTAIGFKADVASNNLTNATAVGSFSQAACSNCMILGSINGVNGATADVNVGIGTNNPQSDLHVNPNAAGSILLGTNKNSGGYTTMEMGISAQSGGYSYIQSNSASGVSYGKLILNPSGSNSYVGINHPNASTIAYPLHINQTSNLLGLRLRNNITIADNWDLYSHNGFRFSYNGTDKAYVAAFDGAYVQLSDARVKTNVNSMPSLLDKLQLLTPKKYEYVNGNPGHQKSIGFIAQEVMPLFPELVSPIDHINKDEKDETVYYGINYAGFSVIAIKAIQEQQVIIELQNRRIEKLEQQMERLLKN